MRIDTYGFRVIDSINDNLAIVFEKEEIDLYDVKAKLDQEFNLEWWSFDLHNATNSEQIGYSDFIFTTKEDTVAYLTQWLNDEQIEE